MSCNRISALKKKKKPSNFDRLSKMAPPIIQRCSTSKSINEEINNDDDEILIHSTFVFLYLNGFY